MKYPEYHALVAPITERYLNGEIPLQEAQSQIREVDKQVSLSDSNTALASKLLETYYEIQRKNNPVFREIENIDSKVDVTNLNKAVDRFNVLIDKCGATFQLETKDGLVDALSPEQIAELKIQLPASLRKENKQLVEYQALAAKTKFEVDFVQ